MASETVSDPRDQRLFVAMEGTQLIQKYIASRATRERELEIATTVDIYRGFVTGMDGMVFQIVNTEDSQLPATLIGLANVDRVCETGRSVDDLDPATRRKVRDYAGVFYKLCLRELEKLNPEGKDG